MAIDPNEIIAVIRFIIATGGDDLRDDSEVYADIYYKDGRPKDTAILAEGVNWKNNTTHEVEVLTTQNTHAGDIDHIDIRFRQGGGGWNGDNWDMAGIELWVPHGDGTWDLAYQDQGANKRFTGHDTIYTCAWWVGPTQATRQRFLRAARAEVPMRVIGHSKA